MSSLAYEGETLDDIAGGRLKVFQKARGYRFSLDALLLSHFVSLRPADNILELGTGSGVISLILAGRREDVRISGIDAQEEMVEMAGRSVALNGLGERIEMRPGNVRDVKALFQPRSFDVVVANPPYRKINSGRINPVKEKALARHEILATAADFLQAAAYVLKSVGRVCLIYPATRMAELFSSMRVARIEPKKLRIVYSRASALGKFLLVEGIMEGGEELEVLPPLVIYDGKGKYTEEMTDIFRELSSP